MSNQGCIYSASTEKLNYEYPNSHKGLFDIDIQVKQGERFLIVGPNGAGKSTLLKILAGQKLIKSGKIGIYGVDPFDLRVKSDKNITYLGTEWANNELTKRDIGVKELVRSIGGDNYPLRRDELISLLDIDTAWRMNQCSDGQRRRVQLLMGLVNLWDLLLLDEVTIDLDVLVRQRLLEYLERETLERGCSVIYATHIFDGLGNWASRIVHMNNGRIEETYNRDQIVFKDSAEQDVEVLPKNEGVAVHKIQSLHPLALSWLRKDASLK
ncbi:putative ATP-binding cassette family ATPase [Martiniozyma asiatica (nom. inval.)]|nr:putative ATP-binding cassette family ATPase [Martiniozyma asiatica]